MKKCECGNETFKIQMIECCDECTENAAWDEDDGEYTLDEKTIMEKLLYRDHVFEEAECNFGEAFGSGCYMFHCAECGQKWHIAMCNIC